MISTYEKANRGKLLALVAVFAMVACVFAAVMPADDVAGAPDRDYTYNTNLGDSINPGVPQEYEYNAAVTVTEDLVIPAGAVLQINGSKFTVNEGVTVTIQDGGKLIIQDGKDDNQNVYAPEVAINGNIVATGNAVNEGAVFQNDSAITLNGNITLERGAQMTGTGSVTMKGTATIDITKRSSDISALTQGTIYMYEGATLNIEGDATAAIEAASDVTYATLGSVAVEAGDVVANSRVSSDLTITVTSSTTSAYAIYDAANDSKVTVRQYAVNVDGTIDAGDKVTFNAAKSQCKANSDDTFTGYYVVDNNKIGDELIVTANTISGSLIVGETSYIVFAAGSYTNISGEVSAKYSEKEGATTPDTQIQLNGTITVSGTVDFNWAGFDGSSTGIVKVAGGSIDITADGEIIGSNYTLTDAPGVRTYGAVYATDGSSNTVITHIRDFNQATVDAAAAAEADEIVVYSMQAALDAQNADAAVEAGAYVVDADITIPADMTLIVGGEIVVASAATLTFSEGAEAENYFGAMIWVDGKVVDQDGFLEGSADSQLYYEVEKLSEDELVTTYTTLAIAIDEAVAGESIQLNGAITIDEDLEIPADVTVVTDETVNVAAITLVGSTLTVNGILSLTTGQTVALNTNEDGDKSAIAVNNLIRNADQNSFTGATVAGAYFHATIGDEEADYVASVAVAAENSAAVEYDGIAIEGDVTFGDVTFTRGENTEELIVTVKGDKVTAGTITLAGAELQVVGTMTGTVAIDATAGAVSIDLDKVSGIAVEAVQTDDGETITSTVEMSQIAGVQYVAGTVTVAAGAVTIPTDMIFGYVDETGTEATGTTGKVTVANGAELVIGSNAEVTVNYDVNAKTNPNMSIEEMIEAQAGMNVIGTLTVDGELTAFIATVSGAVNASEGSTLVIYGCIDGTLSAAEGSDVSLNGIVNGTVSGEIAIWTVVAYPGADMSAAVMNADINGETDVDSTVFYLNGAEAATAYVAKYLNNEITGIIDYLDTTALVDPTKYYSDADLTLEIRSPNDVYVGEYETVYITMEAANAYGVVSAGTGLDLYIDNVKAVSGSEVPLTVGTHTVSFDVKAGYDGANATITFNGQTVQNGGTITVTADMMQDGFTLVASGAAPSQGQVVVDDSDSGMGITDYLLIILVVLVIILAIFVVLRMMRS